MRGRRKHNVMNEKIFCVLVMLGICFLCRLILGFDSVKEMLFTIVISVVGSVGLTAKVFRW